MRHQLAKRSSFGLKSGPRQALIRNLVSSLVEYERIKTTQPRAWLVRRLVEKAITIGKKQNLSSRRVLLSRYQNKKTVSKIVDQLSTRFKDRSSGFTRMIKLGFRKGDQAEMVYLEFVDYDFSIKTKSAKLDKSKDTTKDKIKETPKDKGKKKKMDSSSRLKKKIFLRKKKKKKHIRQIKNKSRQLNRP